jgi:F0F1-type ATP synthase gamma subunit
LPPKHGKTLVILLSSNERFYGKISGELLEYFMIQTSKIRADKIVIGKSANESLKSVNYALAFTPMLLKSDFPSNAELLKLAGIVKQYSKVLVFHPQFESVLVQKPIISDITRSQEQINTKAGEAQKLAQEYNNYIVEPEIQIMAEFFDSQIKTLLLETTFLEAELARTASRLISMDRAQSEAEKYLNAKQMLLFNARRSIANSRILEMVAGMGGSRM